MKSYLVDLVKYNEWANKRFAERFFQLDEKLLEEPLKNSFPSIRLTWLHIYDAEIAWVSRLQGIPMLDWASKKFTGDNKAALELLLESSKKLREFIESQPEDYFDKKLTFQTFTAGTATQLVSDAIIHVVNHSTMHRGQLITMCRELDITPIPATDYFLYARTVKYA